MFPFPVFAFGVLAAVIGDVAPRAVGEAQAGSASPLLPFAAEGDAPSAPINMEAGGEKTLGMLPG